MTRFTVPVEAVSLNHAYRSFIDWKTRRVRRALTSEGKAFKDEVMGVVMAARVKAPAGRFTLSLHFHGNWDTLAGRPRRRDLSNHVKLLEDAICEALGVDDCWIRRVEIEATHAPHNPHIEVTLTPLKAVQP